MKHPVAKSWYVCRDNSTASEIPNDTSSFIFVDLSKVDCKCVGILLLYPTPLPVNGILVCNADGAANSRGIDLPNTILIAFMEAYCVGVYVLRPH